MNTQTKEIISHVSIKKVTGYNLLTREQFLTLPLEVRFDLIMELKVQFLTVAGSLVPVRKALEELHSMAA